MAYDVTLVQVNATIGGFGKTNTNFNFPSNVPFDTLLFSFWTCLPSGSQGGTAYSTNGGPQYTFFFGLDAGTNGGSSSHLTLGTMATSTALFDATFAALPTSVRSNHLISVNCRTQTVQYYVNDASMSVTSGGWIQAGQFQIPTSNIWSFDVGNIFAPTAPAFADLWFGATDAFVDLSIEGNRRKFINADLSPVNLGSNGSAPFGAPPQIFQTIPSAGVPNDFLINRGSGGGSFGLSLGANLVFQAPGTCQLPSTITLTGASATTQVGSLSFPTSTWAITSNVQTPSPGAVGDVWANDSYIDFSDPAVRANFENADGSWLDLGYNGATPTGSSPLLYLTVQLQQPPSDILTGYGQGGAQTHWALLDQGTNPVTGQAYAAMSFDACAPLVGNLELTDIEVIATSPTIPDNEVTLRWSDDAGASWSNGLLRSLGEAGEYFTAPTWYRLGMSRNRILELSWSGARAEALQGVFVDVTISAT